MWGSLDPTNQPKIERYTSCDTARESNLGAKICASSSVKLWSDSNLDLWTYPVHVSVFCRLTYPYYLSYHKAPELTQNSEKVAEQCRGSWIPANELTSPYVVQAVQPIHFCKKVESSLRDFNNAWRSEELRSFGYFHEGDGQRTNENEIWRS